MLGNKRTKVSRHRGSNGHGWGHKKKHRGAGHRGGVGLSGTGSRGDQKKPGVLKGSKSFFNVISAQKGVSIKKLSKNYVHFGKKGFKSLDKKKNEVLSLSYIESHFDKMVENGMIVKEKNDYVFNAKVCGYDKILGRGQFSKKVTIICDEISESAKARVEEVGGKVVLPVVEETEALKE